MGLWEAEPRTSWLVLGCDYPRLSIAALTWLLSQRDPLRPATLACHQDGLLETMVGIYEPAFRYLLEGWWKADESQDATMASPYFAATAKPAILLAGHQHSFRFRIPDSAILYSTIVDMSPSEE